MARVLIKCFVFLIFFLKVSLLFSQYSKEVIYLNFNNEIENCVYKNIKQKWSKPEGIQFNLCGKSVLLFENGKKADTLCIIHVKDYPITTMEEVDKIVKDFRLKTYKKRPPNKNDKLYQAYTKNDIFKTYLVEIIEDDKFVIYPVIWRNQNIID